MQITFLGTGTSHGVPIVGCNCQTCSSLNPKNKRFRSSVYLEVDDISLLIDTPPELRLQLLNNNIQKVDAVLYTHDHADHIMGLDDIRAINRLCRRTIPCYGRKDTIAVLEKIFFYIFNPQQTGGGLPQISLHQVDGPFNIGSVQVQPLPVKHGRLDIFGYRIGKMAYITDCSSIPESTYPLLAGLELLIIDALRYEAHPTHMNIAEALEVVDLLEVSRAYLTHISHSIEHEQVNRQLPANVRLAYDGLQIGI